MGQPYQCTKCGTIYAGGSVGDQPPAISACTIFGESLLQRQSARDPAPSTKGDLWLWLGAFGEPLGIAVVLVAAGFALAAKFF
jgi:hypothetical protein